MKLLFVIFGVLGCVLEARAQTPTSTDGTDFYVGYFSQPHTTLPVHALVGAYTLDTVRFFTIDAQGKDVLQRQIIVQPHLTGDISLIGATLCGAPDGQPSYSSYHITASAPISLQIFSEHNNGSELYLALPTPILGTQYRAVTWANVAPIPNDSVTRPVIEIIATSDNTDVQVTPSCPTKVPVPPNITLQRGQVYRISSAQPYGEDLTGTTIVSTLPVAVISGHEGASLPDLSRDRDYFAKFDNIQNPLIEQLRPEEYWTSHGYPTVPFDTTAVRTSVRNNVPGSMFRVVATSSPLSDSIRLLSARSVSATANPQPPAFAEFDNVQPAMSVRSDSAAPIDCLQFDYYRGSYYGGVTRGYSAPTMMNIIPIPYWKSEYLWRVPGSSDLHGQYIAVIYSDTSVPSILYNGRTNVVWNQSHALVYPDYPQLRCAIIKVQPGTYWATGNSPFMVYSYGRSENNYKTTSAYAAPCGMMGVDWSVAHSEIRFDSTCDGWTGTIVRSGPQPLLVQEIKTFDTKTAQQLHVKASTNYTLSTTRIDDTTWQCLLQPTDRLKDASANLYLVTGIGLQYVRSFSYHAARYKLPRPIVLSRILVGRDTCLRVALVNLSRTDTLAIDSVALRHSAPQFALSAITPSLPITLPPNDSVVVTVCCHPDVSDSLFADTLQIYSECVVFPEPISLTAIQARVNWLSGDQVDSLVCGKRDTVRVWLVNDNPTGGQEVMRDVYISGPDASEFAIVANQFGYMPMQNFPMDPGEKVWIDVAFTPDMTKPEPQRWADRHATLIAANYLRNDPKIALTATILQPQLTVSASAIDLGSTTAGVPATGTFDISNTGNAPLTISEILSSDPRLTCTGAAAGDTLWPGEHRTIAVQIAADQPDSVVATLRITSVEDCAGEVSVDVRLVIHDDPKKQTSAALSAEPFAPQFTCERSLANAQFANTGQADLEIVAADILGDPSGTFTFADGSTHLAILKTLGPSEVSSIPIVSRPVSAGTSSAVLRITWDSLSSTVTTERALTATATVAQSAMEVVAPATRPEPGKNFTASVVLRTAPPVTASQLQFRLRYRGDLFSYRSIATSYGVRILGSQFGSDGYQTIDLVCTAPQAFADNTELCQLTFEVMLSLEDSTAIELSDAAFTNAEDSLCVQTDLHSGFLARTSECGDSLMQQVLRGVTELSIDGIVPSPVSKGAVVQVHSASRADAVVSVIDALGRTIASSMTALGVGPSDISIDVGSLPSGTYAVRVQVQGASLTRMFVHWH